MKSPAFLRVRWLIFALLFGFAVTGYIQRTSLAIAAERMMPELGLEQIQVGWMLTAFLFTYSAFQLPGAVAGQWFGARKTLTALGLATVIASCATAAAPLVAAASMLVVTLLLARSLLGVAQSALFPVASGTIRDWFPVGTWASAQGLLVTGLWLGAAVTPPLVAWVMQHHGWQWALTVTSVPSLALVALWHGYFRDDPAQHERAAHARRPGVPRAPGPALVAHRGRRCRLLLPW